MSVNIIWRKARHTAGMFLHFQKIKLRPSVFVNPDATLVTNIKTFLINTSFFFYLHKISIKNKVASKLLKVKMKDGQVLRHSLNFYLPPKIYWDKYTSMFQSTNFSDIKNPIIVDLGAHQGFFCCRGAFLNRDANFYCIEPDPMNYSILTANAKTAHSKNIKLFNLAIGDQTAKVKFGFGPSSTTGSTENNVFLTPKPKTSVLVDQISFKDFLIQNDLEFIDYLKCDIEGGEYLAFKPKELLLKVKYLMMELHTIDNIPPEDTDLFKYIKKNFDTEFYYPSSRYGNKLIELFGVNKKLNSF